MSGRVQVLFFQDQDGNVLIKIVDHDARLIMTGQVTKEQFNQVADQINLKPAPPGVTLH